MAVLQIATYHVKPADVETVRQRLLDMARQVQDSEPDCLAYDVHISETDGNLFILYELYRSEQALARHRTTPHFHEIVETQVWPLLERSDRELYHPLFVHKHQRQ